MDTHTENLLIFTRLAIFHNSSEAFMLFAWQCNPHCTQQRGKAWYRLFWHLLMIQNQWQNYKPRDVNVFCAVCAVCWPYRLPNVLMFSRAKRSCLSLPDTASFINPAFSWRPRKISTFWGNERQRNGEAGAFSVRWGFCADSYTPYFFLVGCELPQVWQAAGVMGDIWQMHISSLESFI